MKKTLVIIKNQKSVSLTPFIKDLVSQDNSQILFLDEKSVPQNWEVLNFLVLDSQGNNQLSSKEHKFEKISFQGFLEKLFEVDLALVV